MKFLCDRCKTRYSIGDDRVRGKILKIRCKNCANVITVREGMEAGEDAGAGDGPRRTKTTTQAPPADVSLNAKAAGNKVAAPAPAASTNGAAPAKGNALGAAFASAMSNPAAKPPPALEEEWYVSIEGEQSGPYSLAEAQRWVAGKGWDAELHCWSEGFDDWLPVDKVSHFRGLRKKPPAPAGPPPLPRSSTTSSGPARMGAAPQSAPTEDEPKPLFAATMASLERAATTAPAPNPRATPAGGVPAVAKKVNGSVGSGGAAISAKVTPRPGGFGAKVAGFDVETPDQPTQIGVPPFQDEVETTAEPVASARAGAGANLRPFQPKGATTPAPSPFPQTIKPGAFDMPPPGGAAPPVVGDGPQGSGAVDRSEEENPDDDLDIGEVSRVVNLNDLMRPGAKKPRARTNPGQQVPVGVGPVIGRSTGPAQALRDGTGAVSRIDLNTGIPIAPLAPGIDPSTLSPLDPNYVPDGAMQPQPANPQHANRRMLIMLGIGVALLVGVVVVVVMVFNTGASVTGGGLHTGPDYSTVRPEDQHGTGGGGTVAATPANPNPTGANPFLRKTPQPHPQGPIIPSNPPPNSNLPDPGEEIEELAAKNSGLTSRCFLRATKGANAIIVGDVKKLVVTMNVAGDGTVTSVSLDGGHQADALGACLVPVIKTWKFKPNKGGYVRLTMAAPKQG